MLWQWRAKKKMKIKAINNGNYVGRKLPKDKIRYGRTLARDPQATGHVPVWKENKSYWPSWWRVVMTGCQHVIDNPVLMWRLIYFNNCEKLRFDSSHCKKNTTVETFLSCCINIVYVSRRFVIPILNRAAKYLLQICNVSTVTLFRVICDTLTSWLKHVTKIALTFVWLFRRVYWPLFGFVSHLLYLT